MAGRAWSSGHENSRQRRAPAGQEPIGQSPFAGDHAANALGLEATAALTRQSMSFAVSRSPQWGGFPAISSQAPFSCIINGLMLKMTIS
jgi:hypothetical protein